MPIIADKNIDETIKKNIENKFKIQIYNSYPIKSLNSSLSTHPDIQIHFLSSNTAICCPESFEYYKHILGKTIKVIKGSHNLKNTYPDDSAYNVARAGNYVFCNTKYTDSKILEFYNKNNYKIVHTNQGYTKCSLCIASEDTLITEDIGIYKTLSDLKNIKILYVPSGDVELKGFDYGFIGGASGLIDDTLVFTGEVSQPIKTFLSEKNIKFYEASKKRLYDYGSLIYWR